MARPITRWTRRIAIGLLALLLVLGLAAWLALRGSLPQLDGELALPGLSAPIAVTRDALGVVTIEAANERDAMRALGYVHAQERYFEMDLMRRTAAGELAALFGPIAVDTDKRHRMHRMRARVAQQLDGIAGNHRPVLQAYVDGVNAGLAGLKSRPWPYLLLRAQPDPWQLADTALAGYAMYFDLHDADNARELALWKLKPHLPPALFTLLTHAGSSWDAPMMGTPRGDAVLPDATTLDLRRLPASAGKVAAQLPSPPELGSNNFAVSGALTADGRAIVANDMHLTLRAPNIWFRARLRYADARAPQGRVDVAGFTLPGLPAMVVGSNGHVAWGFTNSYGDWLDWQRVRPCTPGSTPAPCARVTAHRERITVVGAQPVDVEVEETAWGPILHREADGEAWALRWVAHLPGSLSLALADFSRAGSLREVLQLADAVAMPAQNLVVGDRSGEIAWRLLGPLPQRSADCVSTPVASLRPADTACDPWALETAGTPILLPASGRAWTANSRVVDGEALQRIGDGGYVLGSRARQIRDRLFAQQRFGERDLLAIQLDDRTLFLRRWWQLLGDTATRARSPALQQLSRAASTWQPHATADSVSYRIVRAWRLKVHERIAEGLAAPARTALGAEFELPALPQLEGVAWPLLTQRPAHLLPSRFASWDALLEDAARDVRDELAAQGPLAERSWGERNTARICHPLAGALPAFGRRALCMPFEPLRGDTAMPRVQTPDMGASERMVVSPGHEADGIIHMPGGQSGHPLSPFWGAGHDDWVHGRPTPFLPGAVQHTLHLVPSQPGQSR
ncbi:penicillin acylase family protein [Lysobacter koreensis]|uniref:Penicillin acylase family protein n=1 Tax=Lysobacter koreensis TaxID=266122 RepID=A0ABW2YIT8_9GAMM